MKKFLWCLGALVVVFCGSLIYYKSFGNQPSFSIEEESIKVDFIHIYGTHLNIGGDLNLDKNMDLILYDGLFKSYHINIMDGKFNLSDYLNDGIYLDNMENGKYYMFLRETYTEDEKEKYKYYSLENTTDYKETVYYTMSNYNKKIVISSDQKYNTLILNITTNRDKNIYDIVLDPGHGGKDPGACKGGYCETDFTMDIAMKVKEKLEGNGIKVKLTYEKDSLSKSEKLNEYGIHGRAIIPKEVNAKYVFSIHLNSSVDSKISGFEVYTANNINYDFAKTLVNNVITSSNTAFSNNTKNRVFEGIYSRNFTDNDIAESLNDYKKENIKAYDVTTNSNYYYMIRETGGIITGAYVDDRNEKILPNPYVKTNVGVESYLLELGFLTSNKDRENIIKNTDKYVSGIAESIISLYNVNY